MTVVRSKLGNMGQVCFTRNPELGSPLKQPWALRVLSVAWLPHGAEMKGPAMLTPCFFQRTNERSRKQG